MSCRFSRETLALHVEGDLEAADAALVSSHLATCDDCGTFLRQLRERQALVKSLRRDTISASECTAMRREVMAIVGARRPGCPPGWLWRVERAAVAGFQRRSLAIAAFALIGVVSVSVLAQIRDHRPTATSTVAVFEGRDILLRPADYRDWITLDRRSLGARPVSGNAALGSGDSGKVYVNASAYRQRTSTGRFPEGTVMVWEAADTPHSPGSPHQQPSRLLVSVKNSARFDGGWGAFDFTGPNGTLTAKAQALPESSGCRTCHRPDAAGDLVLTPISPAL